MVGSEKLMEAIAKNDLAEVQALLSADPGAVNARAPGGETPLLAAIYRNADQIIEVLASQRELDVFEAAAIGSRERLDELIGRDPSLVSSHSGDGWTALHLTAYFGKRDAAELLLKRGASVHELSTNFMTNTPLHAAVAGKQDLALITLLLEHGADVNARSASGYTALHLAASRGNDALVDLLLGREANSGARTDDGKTAAIIAREHGHHELAKRLQQ